MHINFSYPMQLVNLSAKRKIFILFLGMSFLCSVSGQAVFENVNNSIYEYFVFTCSI